MNLDGGVVDVEDVDDVIRLLIKSGVVFFRLGNAGLVEKRGVGWIKWDNFAAGHDRLRLEGFLGKRGYEGGCQ